MSSSASATTASKPAEEDAQRNGAGGATPALKAGASASIRELGDCRFYEAKYPAPESLVMVKVNRIEDLGTYVSLLEYNNVEGMILMSELSKRRFRSVNKLVKVGRQEVVMVLRVDEEKGYIDLSKRRVSTDDIKKCEDRFSKSKKVHQTVRHVAQKHRITVEALNRMVIWPLYAKYGHALDALKEAAVDPQEVFRGMDVPEDIMASLVQDIKLRLSPTAFKIKALIDVWCFGYDGIVAVKKALSAGLAVGDTHVELRVKLIAPPRYVVVASSYDKDEGVARVTKAIAAIKECIERFRGGNCKQEGEFLVTGGQEENEAEDDLHGLEESDESEEEDSDEEEDEGMGRVADDDIPRDQVEEGDDDDEEEEEKEKEKEETKKTDT